MADQPGAPNIPAPAQKNDAATSAPSAAVSSELPLPYEAWQGTRHAPPSTSVAADLPAPLARPRELKRRPIEVGAALAAFLPSCAAGSIDNRGCVALQPGAGLDLAFFYRVGSFFGAGGEAVVSGFGGEGHGAFSGAGGSARFLGIAGRLYFAESGAWDPYASLTIGYAALTLQRTLTSDARDATDGLGARVAGGIDYLLGSKLRVGPTLGFAHFVAWREARCSAAICRDQRLSYGRLLGFATIGLRVTASFGDAL